MARPTMYERVAEELAAWIEDESTKVAEAMREGGRSPFGAPVTEADKLAYYAAQLYLPDGTPNGVGRNQLMQRLGPEEFVRVLAAVDKARGGM